MAVLQQYIRTNGLDALSKLAVTTSRHKDFPNLVQFKYDQLESPFGNPVVQECRGIVLDENDDWKIVCYPYTKFFNYGEGNAVKLDWNKPLKVSAKVDGTLVILYRYRDTWQVATTGKPDAGGNTVNSSRYTVAEGQLAAQVATEDSNASAFEEPDDTNENEGDAESATEDSPDGTKPDRMTFRELFWKVWDERKYQLPEETDRCFMFELVTRNNRVVCKYDEDLIYCHGTRNMATFEEEHPDFFVDKYGWSRTPTFDFKTMEEVLDAASKLNPLQAEGYVICDGDFNRVKVKSPLYVQLALLSTKDKQGRNAKRILTIIQQNEGEEFLSYFPQWRADYDTLMDKYTKVISKVNETFNKLKDLEFPAKFVPEAKKCPQWLQTALFVMKQKKISAKEYFKTRDMSLAFAALPFNHNNDSECPQHGKTKL